MGFIGWMMYVLLGIIFYFIVSFINNKCDINRAEKMTISIILMMVVSGIFSRLGFHFNSDIFLVFIFVFLTDIIYSSYFIDQDFFDKDKGNIPYYIILLIIAYIINQEFINHVDQVFLTGEDLRLVLWFLVLLFIYNFINKRELFKKKEITEEKHMSKESILVNYTKLKYTYHDICNYKNKEIEKIMYALMVFNNNKRSKILRKYDYFMFKLTGNKRKLGIMQIESKKFITDYDSIDIAYKRIEKLVGKKITSTSKINSLEVLKSYCKNDYKEVKYIFDTISNF